VVVGGVAALAAAGFVVTDRWTDDDDATPESDPRGTLSMGGATPGLSAVDIPLDDSYDADRPTGRGREGRAARRSGGARFRTRAIESDPFTMVGLTWKGADRPVRLRTRAGREWSDWRRVQPSHDGPDPGVEGRPGLRNIDLQWFGRSDAVQVEVPGGRPRDLQLTLMAGDRSADRVEPEGRAGRAAPNANRRIPPLHSRGEWGADNRLRSGSPTYNQTIRQVHVHHTVNSNTYGPKDVPGLIRGMYRYHTQNLGWSDIGYNFLVDRFGRIWVGRAGGAGKLVRGAHTLGFNNTSTGISAIGNFEAGPPSELMVTAITQFAAWKLDKYGRDPAGTIAVTSTGSDRFGAGRTVRLPTIDGHRDTNETACPGSRLYARLPEIRRRAAARVQRF